MQEILPIKTMIIHLKLGIHKLLLAILCLILVTGCARFSQYELEDVEKQRLKFNNGDVERLGLELTAGASGYMTIEAGAFNVLQDGNVGINCTAPAHKLEVDGGIKISNSNSRLYFGTEGGTDRRALEGSTNGAHLQVGEGYTKTSLYGTVGIPNKLNIGSKVL